MPFAVVHVAFFVAWILVNTGKLPALAPFDPFPFNFLTQYDTGLLLGSITIFTSGDKAEIKNVEKNLARSFAEGVRARRRHKYKTCDRRAAIWHR